MLERLPYLVYFFPSVKTGAARWVPSGVPGFLVGVAQLVRAPDCGSGGRRFNSARPPLFERLFEV